ncbi:MAG TPA: hypothetical protein PKN33_18710 [Phycisphaerae bacterium]|nr:hypothetical protein [Phycisphaerae bacterium]
MKFEYDPSLVEQATFLAVRRDSEKEAAYRTAHEVAYTLEDHEHREMAFNQLSSQWFFELGLQEPLQELLAERPLIERNVSICYVREASGARKQGAELYVKESSGDSTRSCTSMVEICPETLLDSIELRETLRSDLLKISDMLDETFAYSPELPPADRPRQNLIRDRYRALWDMYVVSRLNNENRLSQKQDRIACNRFTQAFTSQGQPPNTKCLDALLKLEKVDHRQLLEWAVEPRSLPGWSLSESDADKPGQACPLCGFPTYDWYPTQSMDRAWADRVARSLPGWTIKDGMCRQCVETLQSKEICISRE